MKKTVLKWMVRCSAPLSLLLIGTAMGGCSDEPQVRGIVALSDTPPSLPGDVAAPQPPGKPAE